MQRLGLWLARSPIATALKSLVAVLLTLAVAEWTSSGDISFARWETWLIAALAASVPTLVNWINPSDPRYGKASLDAGGDPDFPGEDR